MRKASSTWVRERVRVQGPPRYDRKGYTDQSSTVKFGNASEVAQVAADQDAAVLQDDGGDGASPSCGHSKFKARNRS